MPTDSTGIIASTNMQEPAKLNLIASTNAYLNIVGLKLYFSLSILKDTSNDSTTQYESI